MQEGLTEDATNLKYELIYQLVYLYDDIPLIFNPIGIDSQLIFQIILAVSHHA